MFFVRTRPILSLGDRLLVPAQLASDVEVAVTQRHCRRAGVCPVVIHSETTQDGLPVMLFQVTEERKEVFRLQFKEQRIDELYDIIASQTGQQGINLCHQKHAADLPRPSGNVNVTWVILPEVSV